MFSTNKKTKNNILLQIISFFILKRSQELAKTKETNKKKRKKRKNFIFVSV